MRFWKMTWVVLKTIVRLGGVALSLGLWLLAGVLRLLGLVIASEQTSDYDGKAQYPNYDDSIGFDDHGEYLKPEEEGQSVIWR